MRLDRLTQTLRAGQERGVSLLGRAPQGVPHGRRRPLPRRPRRLQHLGMRGHHSLPLRPKPIGALLLGGNGHVQGWHGLLLQKQLKNEKMRAHARARLQQLPP